MKTKCEIDIMRWLINFDCIYARDRKLEIEFDNGTGQEIDKILTMYIDYDDNRQLEIKFRYRQIIELNNFITMVLKTDKGLII